MKLLKRLSTIAVAAVMMMATTSTTFAAPISGSGDGTITIDRDDAAYKAYRVLDSTTKTMSNNEAVTVYSINTSFEEFFKNNATYSFSADKGILKNGEVLVSDDDAKKSGSLTQGTDMAAFTASIISYIEAHHITGADIKGKEATNLAQGYYLVSEPTITVTQAGSSARVPSRAMLVEIKMNQKVAITPKDSTLKIDKTVNNAKENVAGIGETLNFAITSGIPTYSADYKDIKYELKDTMSKGLSLNSDSIIVKVGADTVYTKGAKIGNKVKSVEINKSAEGITEIYVTFNYNEILSDALAGSQVNVAYQAAVNDQAIVTQANTNDATLIYTTNNEGITSGTKTYTYELDLLKIDGNTGEVSKALAGATFELKRVVAGGLVSITNLTTDANGKISLKGIGEGEYVLTETKAPTGYSKLAGEIRFTVTASEHHEIASVVIKDQDQDIVTMNTTTNTILLTIKNYKGISLPETGGMGTTLFIAAGAVLIVAGGVLLAVYTRKSKKTA